MKLHLEFEATGAILVTGRATILAILPASAGAADRGGPQRPRL
jgi:hypothetical protein